jgi:hypothetical protein
MARLALLVVVLAAVAGCGGGDSGGDAVPSGSTARAEGAGATLEGETLAGERLSLADLRGKPVYVNVWASW